MKILFLLITVSLCMLTGMAQPGATLPEKKSFLSFSTGLSIPMLCYAADDIRDKTSGYARAGFTLNLNYGYLLGKNLGITGSVFYTTNPTGKNVVQSSGNNHYKYLGIVAGPLLTKKLFPKTDGDFKFMAGMVRAWSPLLKYQGETILNGAATTTFTYSLGIGLRYHFSENKFLLFRADHFQINPKFKGEITGENVKVEQHVVLMNFDTGMGIKF